MRPKASTVLFAGPFGCPGWLGSRRGSPMTGSAKRAIAATVSSSGTVESCVSLTMIAKTSNVAPEQRVERGQRVADGAEITAGDQDQRQLQRHHHVEDGALAVERHHDAADAFDQQDIPPPIDRGLAECDDRIDVDAAAFALGREIGRQRGAKAPRRNPVDLLLASPAGRALRRSTPGSLAAACAGSKPLTTGLMASTSRPIWRRCRISDAAT